VTSRHILVIVAIAQGVLLLALITLIALNRWVRLRRSAKVDPRRIELDTVMQRWVLGEADAGAVAHALGWLPIPFLIDALVTWSARVPGERWRELSSQLEHRWWARVLDTLKTLCSDLLRRASRRAHACLVPAVVRVSQPRHKRKHVW